MRNVVAPESGNYHNIMLNQPVGILVPPPTFGVVKDRVEKPLSTIDVFDSFSFPADRTQNISSDPNDSDNASGDYGEEDYSDDGNDGDVRGDQKKRKRNRPNITEEQRIDRRFVQICDETLSYKHGC